MIHAQQERLDATQDATQDAPKRRWEESVAALYAALGDDVSAYSPERRGIGAATTWLIVRYAEDRPPGESPLLWSREVGSLHEALRVATAMNLDAVALAGGRRIEEA